MIITILGTSGAFFNSKNCTPQLNDDGTFKLQSAKYNSFIFGKENKEYRNSTHFLLENFPKEKFVFIGTACAISFQKAILKESLLLINNLYKLSFLQYIHDLLLNFHLI